MSFKGDWKEHNDRLQRRGEIALGRPGFKVWKEK